MSSNFLERLAQAPILCDGAMGTMLYARGIPYDRCFDELNLSAPEIVRGIHLDYIHAGAKIIETNSFGANALKLAEHGLEKEVARINRAAVEVARQARQASGRDVFVAGSVGPLGKALAPFGTITPRQAQAAFREQIEALVEAGVDLIIFETIYDLNEMEAAIQAARTVTSLPVVAQMTFNEDGITLVGNTPAQIVSHLEDLRVDVIGANCSVGPHAMLAVLRQILALSHTPVAAQPNAGFPAFAQGRYVYTSSPEYMASEARAMVEMGVRLVGGCCGTTPEHIAAIRRALDEAVPVEPERLVSVAFAHEEQQLAPPIVEPVTPFAQKLGHKFVATVEVDPPRGFDATEVIRAAAMLKEAGVDAIDVADSPRAQARMSALALSTLVQRHAGIEVILHVAARHRNLLALHSELTGAHALGVRNVFVVMGDLPHTGDYPQATPVSDITPSGLMQLIHNFNQGIGISGKPIKERTSFLIGCAVNLGAEDVERELRIFEKKIASGARFALTQPVYSAETVDRWLARLGGKFPIPVILGVLPLRSVRHAEFLQNEVPGIAIAGDVMARLRDPAKNPAEEGIRMAQELLRAVRDKVAGAYFMPPFGKYEIVLEVLEGIAL